MQFWLLCGEKINKIISILIIAFLESMHASIILHGQTQAAVTLSPSSLKIQPMVRTLIDVDVEGAVNLFAASVTIAFDSTILRYDSVVGGTLLAQNNANSVFLGVVPEPPPPSVPEKMAAEAPGQHGDAEFALFCASNVPPTTLSLQRIVCRRRW